MQTTLSYIWQLPSVGHTYFAFKHSALHTLDAISNWTLVDSFKQTKTKSRQDRVYVVCHRQDAASLRYVTIHTWRCAD